MTPPRRLVAAVYVQDPRTREDVVLLPGESPAPEIAGLVTNPHAWDTPPSDGTGPGGEPAPAGAPERAVTGQESEESAGGPVKKSPPRRARQTSVE